MISLILVPYYYSSCYKKKYKREKQKEISNSSPKSPIYKADLKSIPERKPIVNTFQNRAKNGTFGTAVEYEIFGDLRLECDSVKYLFSVLLAHFAIDDDDEAISNSP